MRMRAMYSTVTTQTLSREKTCPIPEQSYFEVATGSIVVGLFVSSDICYNSSLWKCGHLLCFTASVSTDQYVVVHHASTPNTKHLHKNTKLNDKKKSCRHAMSVCQVHTQPTIDSPIVQSLGSCRKYITSRAILTSQVSYIDVIISMTLESSAQTQINVHHSLLSEMME